VDNFFSKSNAAIIGGGGFCKAFLMAVTREDSEVKSPRIIGVSDPNDNAIGLSYARELGIYTTGHYTELYELPGLDIIIELTNDYLLSDIIKKNRPQHVEFVDHFEARTIYDTIQIEEEKSWVLQQIRENRGDIGKIEVLVEELKDFILFIKKERNQYAQNIRGELISSEKALSQIVQGSTIPTFVINADHVVTHWNRACEALTGYAADAIIGTRDQWKPFREEKRPIMADLVLKAVSKEDAEKYYGTKWRKSVLIDGAYEAVEYFPNLGEDGKWLFFTAAPIKAPDGRIVGAIETLWDRTSEKRAQKERERHHEELSAKAKEVIAREKALSQIVQGSTIPTFVIDQYHIITHWNKALEKLTGYAADEMVGTDRQSEPFYKTKRPSMADVILDQIEVGKVEELYGRKWKKSALIDGAYEAEGFFQTLGEDGKWCWFTAAPIKAPDGTIVGAVETLWDTTERKNAEEQQAQYTRELAQRERAMYQIIQGSTIPTFVIDKDHVVTHWNRALEELSGFSADELVGTRNQCIPFYGTERPTMADVILDQIEAGEITKLYGKTWRKSALIKDAYEAEAFIPNLGEDGRWCWFTGAPIKGSGGTITGAIETLLDKTEEKRLQHELVNSERLAAVGQTVAGLAHSIKNILHGLKGGSYLVDLGLKKDDTERLKSGWDMIKRNITRTSELVMDLLSYSKERKPEYEPCDPNEIVGDMAELIVQRAQENDIEIVKEFDPSIGEVVMDPRTLHESLLNLASNAVDACIFDEDTDKKWRVELKTKKENGTIRFDVADTGMGMSDVVRKKLFTSFFSTKGHRGTGLGLLVTRKLIEEHGGSIDVASLPGIGTTFIVRLPYRTGVNE
jgi:PAS domain S-box-containing protein